MMRAPSYFFGIIRVCASVAAALVTLPASANPGETQHWQFKVFLDDREIGYHKFTVSRDGNSRRVESRASFDVKVLFINAYRYRHQNVENWNADCLTNIDAATDANGEKFVVLGSRDENGFSLSTGDRETSLPQCVMTFAYWNPEFLKASRLVNPQTGDYDKVEIIFEGRDTVEIDDRQIPADRYQIRLEEGPITVWYATDDQRWLALTSVAKGSRILRYEPISLPAPANPAVARSLNGRAARNDA